MLTEFLQETFRRFSGDYSLLNEQLNPGSTCASRLDQAVELVVEETSSRLRAVPGYARRLKEPVATTFRYIEEMIEQVPGVFSCRSETFSDDHHVNAFFVSPAHMREVFSLSKEVRELFNSNPEETECYALLCMKKEQRQQLGVALFGNEIRRDVLQTTISFSDHQIVSPGVDEADARCALKCCVFKSFIEYIRNEASSANTMTTDLINQHRILCSRLQRVAHQTSDNRNRANLENQIFAINEQLKNLELRIESLEDHLEFLIDRFKQPEKYVYGRTQDIYVDRLGIRREDGANGSANKLSLAEIQIARHEPRVAALVSFPRKELLPEKDFLHEASIFLTIPNY